MRMRYEFGEEKAKRKRRRTIFVLAAVLMLLSVVASGLYFQTKREVVSVQEQKAPAVAATNIKVPEQMAKKPAEATKDKPKESLPQQRPQALYSVIIDKSDYSLTLNKENEVEKVYDVAIGKNPGQKQKPGDLRTPTGTFAVDEILDSSYWKHDFKDGKGEIEGAYGPWFISLETGWEGIGIHGTHDPSTLRTMVSEGCIRMKNEEVAELRTKVGVGTKVIIRE